MSDLTKEQIEEIRAAGLLAGTFDILCDMALAKKDVEERASQLETENRALRDNYERQVKETYRQWVSSMEWKSNAENALRVFCPAHQYMVKADGDDGDKRNHDKKCPFCEAAALHGEKQDPWIPNINVRYVISDGLVKGDTFLNVLEIQREDDGSLTVVASQ